MCKYEGKISSEDPDFAELDITTASIAAAYEAGMGPTLMNTVLSVMDVLPVTNSTFTKTSAKLNEAYPVIAEECMKQAAELEISLAKLENNSLTTERRGIM